MSARRDYLSARNVTESVRQSRLGDYTYLNNAKSGCSTIKYLLWLSEFEQGRVGHLPSLAQLHQEGLWPRDFKPVDGSEAPLSEGGLKAALAGPIRRWLRPEKRRPTFVFSFVRNPFVRAYSCYRDKIARPTPVRDRFCLKYGLDRRGAIAFDDFLRAILSSDPCDEDQHWRAQTHNVLFGAVPNDFIGNLEHYDEDIEEVRSRIGVSGKGEVKNAYTLKSETAMRKSFSDASIRLVLEKYKQDFETFGYGEDLSRLTPIERRKGSGAAPRTTGNLRYVNLLGQLEASPRSSMRALEALAPSVGNPFILETAYSLARRLGDVAGAERIAAACAERFPGHHIALWLEAQEAVRSGRAETAGDAARALTRMQPDSDAYWRLSHELSPDNDGTPSGEAVRSLALLNPRSTDWQLRYAQVALDAGNPEDAREAFERALRADPACEAASAGIAALASAERRAH